MSLPPPFSLLRKKKQWLKHVPEAIQEEIWTAQEMERLKRALAEADQKDQELRSQLAQQSAA